MTGEDTQDLSLGSFCYTKGLSLHEFIHALGKIRKTKNDEFWKIPCPYSNIEQ